MNLLMILLIVLGIWVSGAICYFAWRLMPAVEKAPDADPPDAALNERVATGDPTPAADVDPNARS